ncbi:Choline/ethanolamine kinase [Dictyocaulus viviparus]|uniref:Choline/ethanolamine kinase n=1 Tax=Dictyocaulus viviparus TaxID=29172 RepID=A0A0D8XK50_DICVI|nr:Choline/ethanolamine kinase [Dictyocaulus viviparus]
MESREHCQVLKTDMDCNGASFSLLDLFSKFNPMHVDDCIVNKAKELCAQYLGGAWQKISASQFSLTKLSGGLTNLVFRCTLTPEVSLMGTEPRSVILRIQTGTDSLQLMREIAIFTNLSAHGYGPKLLGIFPGGRIEEYIPSRTLIKEEIYDRRFVPSIASLMAKLNSIEMPLPKFSQYIPLIHSWLQKYRSNGGGSLNLMKTAVVGNFSFPDILTIDDLEKEIEEVGKFLESQRSPCVFCHHDVVEQSTANELERHFLTGKKESDLKLLMSECRRFLPLPHLFWAIWNILCDQELGMIKGIDFITHAKDRFIMYYLFKSNMYKY